MPVITSPKGRTYRVKLDRLAPVISARILEQDARRRRQLAELAIFFAAQYSPVDTGRLRGSIRILGQTPQRITIGSRVPYAKYMERRFQFLRQGIRNAAFLLGFRRSGPNLPIR